MSDLVEKDGVLNFTPDITTDVAYEVVIVTNLYAGNFEREMCAFITGAIGECQVGKNLVEEEIENMFYNYIDTEYFIGDSEYPCPRPVEIYNIDHYSALAIGFHHKLTTDLLKVIEERANKFAEGYVSRKDEKLEIKKIIVVRVEKTNKREIIWARL